ncbi:MAG: hypothetical protein U5K75_03510 [Ahrensia sp.]|nr:hypothetical protein [Ahrensia sp.]
MLSIAISAGISAFWDSVPIFTADKSLFSKTAAKVCCANTMRDRA